MTSNHGPPPPPPPPPPAAANLPVVFFKELKLGPMLGSGGFCTVSAVRKIELMTSDGDGDGTGEPTARTSSRHSRPHRLNLTAAEKRDRIRLAARFADMEYHHYTYRTMTPEQQLEAASDPTVQRPPRIALKRLKASLGKDRYQVGLKDLMAEVKILSLIGNGHPNIINIYGVGVEEEEEGTEDAAAGDASDGNDDARNTKATAMTPPHARRIQLILLDQLRSTLKNMLYKWREARGLGIAEAMNMAQQSTRDLWLERLVVLDKVSSAVAYLHSKHILHRDLNPDNIGFDADDTVKLFDFGLARTVDPSRRLFDTASYVAGGAEGAGSSGPQDAYGDLTGNTGTVRYMAPEVALCHPYGTTADVYSLSIIMHEVLSLHKPYTNIPPGLNSFHNIVVKGGKRPPIDYSWPEKMRTLLENMWQSDPAKRPKSSDVVAVLEGLLRGSDEELFPVRTGLFARRTAG